MRALARLALAFALGLASFWAYFGLVRARQPAYWPDSFEYAQVGRNVAEGLGLRTSALLERELLVPGFHEIPAPYFLHDPGQALAVGLAFRVFGASGKTLAWTSGVCFALACALAAALAGLLFGPAARIPAAILTATATPLLEWSATGLSEPTAACALTLVFVLLLRARGSAFRVFLAGLAFGVTAVIRSNALPFLPLLIGYVVLDAVEPGASWLDRGMRARRARPAAAFLAGLVLALGPSALRSQREVGSPFFSVAGGAGLVRNTGLLPDPLRTFDPIPPVTEVLARPELLFRKSRFWIRRALSDLLAGGLQPHAMSAAPVLLLLALALSGAPLPEPRERRRFRLLLLACIFTALLVGSLFELRWRHLFVFAPAGAALLAGFLVTELGRAAAPARSYRVRLGGALLVLGLLGVLPLCARPVTEEAIDRDRIYAALGLFLRQNTEGEAIVMVDSEPLIPLSALAWHGRRHYVSYSEGTLLRVVPVTAGRPLYYLRLRLDPEASENEELPPGAPSFAPVARFKDPVGRSTAWLRRR